MNPAVKRATTYVVLVAALAAIGVWLWHGIGTFATPEPEGIQVVCSRPDCGRHFVIPRDQSRTYPRGPNGEGFKCKHCGQFSAQIAAQCASCGQWYLATDAQGRTDPGCPHCRPTEAK